MKVAKTREPDDTNIIDLMAALKKRLRAKVLSRAERRRRLVPRKRLVPTAARAGQHEC